MLIKELEDVLVLIKEMPRAWQLKCVRRLGEQLENWEQRQSEPELSDEEWYDLQNLRRLKRALARPDPASESPHMDEVRGLVTGEGTEFVGTVDSFYPDTRFGSIKMADGQRASVSGSCLNASAWFRNPRVGEVVRFRAIRKQKEWWAIRVLEIKRNDE